MRAAGAMSSLLFVPGTKPERFGKALACGADAVCIDLEDSVPASGKAGARAAAMSAMADGHPRLHLRINAVSTRAGLEDIIALAHAPRLPGVLLVPMVESAQEVAIIASVLGERTPALIPLIETAKGLDAAVEIAAAPAVSAMMFGGGDLSADLGVALAWAPLLWARSSFIAACARGGVPAIDVPFIGLDDPEGLRAEAEAAKSLGFSAKAAIHPAQVDIINAVFRPTPEQIAEAEEAQKAFDAAGGAAVRFNGRMLEAPIMRRYQRILAMRSNEDA